MAQFALVPACMVHQLPEGFDLVQAAVLEPAAVALQAIRRADLQKRDGAAVIGLGPLGLLVCALLSLRVVETVVGVDPVTERRNHASATGATALAPNSSSETDERLRELCGGTGVDQPSKSSVSKVLPTGFDATRTGGRLVLVGLADQLEFNALELVNREISIIPSVGYNNCHVELIHLVHTGQLDLSAFSNDVVALEHAPEVLNELAAGAVRGVKTLIDCRGEPV